MLWEIALRWLVPFALGGAVSAVCAWGKGRSRRDRAICDGLECLLRAEIISCYERYAGAGVCPVYVKESLKRAYRAYHELGGNDVATSLYEKTMRLPEIGKAKEWQA